MNVDTFLEHHGVKGQRWGVRNLDRITRIIRGKTSRDRNIRKAVGLGIGATAIAATSAILARSGQMSISDARRMTEVKSGQLVRDIGHQFVSDSIDKQVVLNYGRQIKEGLINIHS